ncbi:Undecaprenyl-phosphate 4-deoxy-4-formamido-L-arabinose transferase [Sedimentisphaera cyanobacteriorum]|uniref:Undecaprenyl-phosphate 4-deoxy-4-formamido-L-arabinose transferase n=1 Tax=Sedimentisphaera cyanobacteriorum TaxID=1940790 RepID=A0A1Q2HLW5_9BACT|nr:glycosyltransferase family 2 protein [Sedimentisphaera cyanobacteriorum]AQQ08350.1 Undecaprenyl-phosphate 4-deoxy-4-formamido-L-arabinose transferase [Sedimentisphaera cyanobacteriorum]
MSENIDISVIVPVFNERDNIQPLHEQIASAMKTGGVDYSYEIIFVNDGSWDGTAEVLGGIFSNDSNVTVVNFRRNFGQTAAMQAGFERARGEVIIPMDGDLQNDPADIPALMAKLDEGYDIVSGWRKSRKDRAFTRRLPSMLANFIIRRITNVGIHDFGCTMKAYRREVISQTKLYGETHRFIPAVAQWLGAKVGEIEVNHRPRKAGKTKYNLSRTYKVVLDLITVSFMNSYSTKPLYVFGRFSIYSGLAAGFSFVVMIYQKIANGYSINRNPLLILGTILTIAALQLIMMGLLAELMVRTYHESQNRPTYAVRSVLSHRENQSESKLEQ